MMSTVAGILFYVIFQPYHSEITNMSVAQRPSPSSADSILATIGKGVESYLEEIMGKRDSLGRQYLVDNLIKRIQGRQSVLIEDSIVWLFYHGIAKRVAVPGDLNGWRTSPDSMTRIRGTDLWYISKVLDPRARFEYKLAIDSTWILDPLNPRTAAGGYGLNSEIRMPQYQHPAEVEYQESIEHGTLDTIFFRSKILQREHLGFVYKPANYSSMKRRLPSLYVTDGGEYITLGNMLNVLDNLIAQKAIEPVVVIFLDPRTDIERSETSMRMRDYTMSDSFLTFLTKEVRPFILRRYRVRVEASRTGIMGASLGGLIATYASFRYPRTFGLCAAQSPSYWWNDEAMIDSISSNKKKGIKIYVDSGTIKDALGSSRKMASVLEAKGYQYRYAEYPEGHNWVNWRARISHILKFFFNSNGSVFD